MGFPTIFALFVIFALLFNHRLNRLTRLEREAKVAFWESERDSLSVRKKEFVEENYLRPDISSLTFPQLDVKDYDLVLYESLKSKLLELSTKDMMNFSHLTNTEIRLQFGTANQTAIADNESAYNTYLKTLADYGKFMNEQGELNEAIIALEECIRMKSEYSRHYLFLAQLFAIIKNEEAFHQLCEKASTIDTTKQTNIHQKLINYWSTLS